MYIKLFPDNPSKTIRFLMREVSPEMLENWQINRKELTFIIPGLDGTNPKIYVGVIVGECTCPHEIPPVRLTIEMSNGDYQLILGVDNLVICEDSPMIEPYGSSRITDWLKKGTELFFITNPNRFSLEQETLIGVITSTTITNYTRYLNIRDRDGKGHYINEGNICLYSDQPLTTDILSAYLHETMAPWILNSPKIAMIKHWEKEKLLIKIKVQSKNGENVYMGIITGTTNDSKGEDKIQIRLNENYYELIPFRNIVAYANPFSPASIIFFRPTLDDIHTCYDNKKNTIFFGRHPFTLKDILIEGTITQIKQLGSEIIVKIGNYKLGIALSNIRFISSVPDELIKPTVDDKLKEGFDTIQLTESSDLPCITPEIIQLTARPTSVFVAKQILQKNSGFFKSLFEFQAKQKPLSLQAPFTKNKKNLISQEIDLREYFATKDLELLLKYFDNRAEALSTHPKEITSLQDAVALFIIGDYFICAQDKKEKAIGLVFENILDFILEFKWENKDDLNKFFKEKKLVHPLFDTLISKVKDLIKHNPQDCFLNVPQEFSDCIDEFSSLKDLPKIWQGI